MREAVECPMLRIAGHVVRGGGDVRECGDVAGGVCRIASSRGMLMSDAKMAVDVDPIAMM